MKKTLDVVLTTALGAGFWPWGPGTMGTAMGILLWWGLTLIVPFHWVPYITLAGIIVVTLVSVSPINRLEQIWGRDPSRVVIDEVVGVWICLLAVPAPNAWLFILAAFLLFRLFDIWKPLGIRRMEAFPGGWGVMLDDILAGIYGLSVIAAYRMLT